MDMDPQFIPDKNILCIIENFIRDHKNNVLTIDDKKLCSLFEKYIKKSNEIYIFKKNMYDSINYIKKNFSGQNAIVRKQTYIKSTYIKSLDHAKQYNRIISILRTHGYPEFRIISKQMLVPVENKIPKNIPVKIKTDIIDPIDGITSYSPKEWDSYGKSGNLLQLSRTCKIMIDIHAIYDALEKATLVNDGILRLTFDTVMKNGLSTTYKVMYNPAHITIMRAYDFDSKLFRTQQKQIDSLFDEIEMDKFCIAYIKKYNILTLTHEHYKHPYELSIYKCNTSKCSGKYGFLGQIFRQKKSRKCPTCLHSICACCGNTYHGDIECGKDQIECDESIAMQITRKCPFCDTRQEKDGGCDHIKCVSCDGHWCWGCRTRFSNGDQAYRHMIGTDTYRCSEPTEPSTNFQFSDSIYEHDVHIVHAIINHPISHDLAEHE